MHRREEIAARVSDAILRRLITRRLLEVKDEGKARATCQRILAENIQIEEEIDAAARELLQTHARDIREKGLDYRQLFARAKGKLARDRGFVL